MERRTQLDIGIYNDATQIGVVKFFLKVIRCKVHSAWCMTELRPKRSVTDHLLFLRYVIAK